LVAAGLAIAAGIALTGALHEDGLADTADGLGGGHARERALEIMRDSTIGTYGAAALVFSIGLRWAALASLTAASGAAALIIAHSAARGSIAIALNRSSYAREKGTGELVAHGVPDADLWWTLAFIAALALVAGGWTGLIGVAFGLAAATFLHMRVDRRIGGYTGDTLGAMEQICEITVLLVLCSLWRMS
jgi:adenosylcobinamide-GDP ribazoletransferase